MLCPHLRIISHTFFFLSSLIIMFQNDTFMTPSHLPGANELFRYLTVGSMYSINTTMVQPNNHSGCFTQDWIFHTENIWQHILSMLCEHSSTCSSLGYTQYTQRIMHTVCTFFFVTSKELLCTQFVLSFVIISTGDTAVLHWTIDTSVTPVPVKQLQRIWINYSYKSS